MRRGGSLLLPVLALALAAAPAPAAAGDGMRGPGPLSTPRPPLGSRPPDFRPTRADLPAGPGTAFFLGLLRFYGSVVSPVDGDRCSMAPTCSLYSRQALWEEGVLLGILLTADRLLHEADEIPFARRIVIDGKTYYLDPLENNTYWWRSE